MEKSIFCGLCGNASSSAEYFLKKFLEFRIVSDSAAGTHSHTKGDNTCFFNFSNKRRTFFLQIQDCTIMLNQGWSAAIHESRDFNGCPQMRRVGWFY